MKYLILLVLLCSCASRPRLYPNRKYKAVGKELANKDIDTCSDEAENFLDSPRGRKIVQSAGRGAAVSGAIGAVFGLISGNIVRGAATGAAVGAAGGATAGALSPDQVKMRYVNHCLSKKGYKVLGWD